MEEPVVEPLRVFAAAKKLSFFVLVCWLLLLRTGEASGLGILRYSSVTEMVTNGRGILGPVFVPGDSIVAVPPRVMVRATEEVLYGLPGLRTSAVLLAVRTAGLLFSAEAAQLSSPIGKETRLSFTPAFFGARWAISIGVVYDGVALREMEGSFSMGATVRSMVRVADSFVIGGEIDRVRLAGEELPGADATLTFTAVPARTVSLHGSVEMDRYNGVVPGVACSIGGLGPARILTGYEGGTDVLKGALSLRWKRLDLSVGIFCHPVLGDKKGVTLTWTG